MSNPFFSVIITTAARTEERISWFLEALCSVFAQTFNDWELIVVDDAGEGTIEKLLKSKKDIVSKVSNKIILVKNADNIGLQKSFNVGLYHAKGKWIVRLDDDDKFMPCTLNELYLFIRKENDPNLAFIYSDIAFMHGGIHQYPDWDGTLIGTENIGHVQAIRRDALLKIGGWRVDIDYAADTDCVIRLIEAGYSIRHIPKILYLNRHHRDQYTVQYVLKGKDPVKAKKKVFQDALNRNYELWRSDHEIVEDNIVKWEKHALEMEKIKKYMKGNGLQIGYAKFLRRNRVICIDFNNYCHYKLTRLNFPFKDETFDYVFITYDFCEMDITTLIGKILKCVKKYGYIILLFLDNRFTKAKYNSVSFIDILDNIVNKFSVELIQYDTIKNNWSFECVLRKS